ncbi:MAG TPA: GMC family oxidoreductase N-terminal domain-containing protein [Candidatus Limnocylindria bacterium]|nr:GMC family oxidoreductase N-terminal domain-containing protein [Candidatus Limnocylindria bacterium]
MADRDRTLAALCDAFVPGDGDLPSASRLGVHRILRAEVTALARPALVAELDQLLDTIESPFLNLALTGRAVRFSALGQVDREDYLKRWAESPLPLKRRAFQVMKRLVLLYTYGQDGSPYAALSGYVRPPLERPADPVPLRARRGTAGETIDADVCVIGSGAGGGVVAATLAAAGMHVVVLERAVLRTELDFDGRELAGYASLFVDRGIAATHDRAIAIFAGSAVGGGTIVNWNTSLRISAQVRQEWHEAGIDDLDEHYDAVSERIDVDTDESVRNGPNAALERGLGALGLASATIARNVRGCVTPGTGVPACGPCTLGCRRGAKCSTLRTYLADACARGAEILHGSEARRIETADGRVTSVVARVDGGELRVRAPLVALAGGAILSPALLLRSGIATAQAGRHLHLHPVSVTSGVYDEDLGGVWSGVPQSVLGDEFAEEEEYGYGFRIEIPQAQPGVLAASFPWWGSGAHRARAAQARHIAPFIAIARDRTEGRVRVDREGEPVVDYSCGTAERRLLTRAMTECARIHAAAGARGIFTLHTPPLEHGGGPIEPFLAEIERRGVVSNRVALFSAHQMSSCRIGADPATSVADADGQVRGVRGLYVTDASAFPNASGVNPMLTVMALARRTASRVAAS